MVQHVEVTILAIRNVSIKNKVENTRFDTTEFQNLVVAKSKVSGHRTVSFSEDTVFTTARGI